MSELQYQREGDYQIPALSLPEQMAPPLGKYGRMRQSYLKEHREILYNQLLVNGQLYKHLAQTDQSAQERHFTLMQQGMKKEGLTETLKAKDPLRWTGLMNSLKAQAEEVILQELITS